MIYSGEDLDLGPCCACGASGPAVRNIVMLHKKAAVAGPAAWGCFTCGLAMEGAVAVVCDSCLESAAEIRFAVMGEYQNHDRIPLAELTGRHIHNLSKHPELWPASNPKAAIVWFEDSPDAGHPDCLCSWCGQIIEVSEFPARLFRHEAGEAKEARFHMGCLRAAGVGQGKC